MKTTFGFLAAIALSTSAFAADIFVRETKGMDLSQRQSQEITDLVKNAVNNMVEHTLVDSESQADFVLQPSIHAKGEQQVIRIEKEKDGEILAMSEETITNSASNRRAFAVTETALQDDQYVRRGNMASTGEEEIREFEADSITTDTPASDAASSANESFAAGPDGEIAAASPRFQDPNRSGFFQIGVGPAFGLGLETDEAMVNVNGSYNVLFTQTVIGKGFVDLNLGTGAESARFINVGLGAEYYPAQRIFNVGEPYIGADLGFAFTRDGEDRTKDAPAIGAGAGLRFQAAQLNWDVNAHYTLLLSEIDDSNPSILGLRLAVAF